MSAKQTLQQRYESVRHNIPLAICSACHEEIPDENDVTFIKYLKGKYTMWRIYHKNCYDALSIGFALMGDSK